MKIVIGSDHRGISLKQVLIEFLDFRGHETIDVQTPQYEDGSIDYPDAAHNTIGYVLRKEADRAILICGSGIGINMAANRERGIRAALCRTAQDAEMARRHNNANVLCLGADVGRVVISKLDQIVEMKTIINTFLVTDFEGGRHLRRVHKIDNPR